MTLAAEALFDGEPCAHAVAHYERQRIQRAERLPRRMARLDEVFDAHAVVASWCASYAAKRLFGLTTDARMPAMDGGQARNAREALSSMYWSGLASRDEQVAARAEIDRASGSYFERGVVAYPRVVGAARWRRAVVARLIERDGDDCWLCAKPMPETDRTIEHKLAQSLGGGDEFTNLALTHGECNRRLGNLPVADKEAMRSAALQQLETGR